jgi:hypothetical protein
VNHDLNKRLTIINVDAPELRTFLVNTFPSSKSLEITSLLKKNYFAMNFAKWKIRINAKVVEVKILIYPTLVRVYQNTVMRNKLLHRNFGKLWRSRRAIRIVTNTDTVNSFNSMLLPIQDHHRLTSSVAKFSAPIFVTSNIEKHSFSFLPSNSCQVVFRMDYHSIQCLRVEFGKYQVVKERFFDTIPGYWGHKFEHGISSKSEDQGVLIICDESPVLSLDNIDHLFLDGSAATSGVNTLFFACKRRDRKVKNFVSDSGISYRFFDFSEIESGSTQTLISELDRCSWIMIFSSSGTSRIFGAAALMGIPATIDDLGDAPDQADLVYRISEQLIFNSMRGPFKIGPPRTDLEIFRVWKSQIVEFLE